MSKSGSSTFHEAINKWIDSKWDQPPETEFTACCATASREAADWGRSYGRNELMPILEQLMEALDRHVEKCGTGFQDEDLLAEIRSALNWSKE